eukprot:jgi/Botrbrau1/234/Bobra.0022s0211.2
MDPTWINPVASSSVQKLPLAHTNNALRGAYEKLSQGDPVAALQVVIAALKAQGSTDAAVDLLEKARDALLAGRTSPHNVTDELNNLFSQINLQDTEVEDAIAESSSVRFQNYTSAEMSSTGHSQLRPHTPAHAPILEETGRGAIADAALSDGSSFVCSHCGGVVKKDREAIHYEYWCPGRSILSP